MNKRGVLIIIANLITLCLFSQKGSKRAYEFVNFVGYEKTHNQKFNYYLKRFKL